MKAIARELLGKNPYLRSTPDSSYPKNKYTSRYVYGVRVTVLKPAYVYYIKLVFPHITVYKIGFTSTSVRSRIAWMGLAASVKVTVLCTIKMKSSTRAFHLEQLLHKEFASKRYYGTRLLNSGNTELYSSSLV